MKPCPQCSSDQIKKASLVYEEGVRAGAGVAIGTGGIGVAAGSSVSVAAARYAPPVLNKNAYMQKTGHGLLLVFFAPMVIALLANGSWGETSWIWKAWAVVGLVVGAITGAKFDKQQKTDFELAKATYERTFVCQRCGHAYIPFD